MVAAEASGDLLGAHLIAALKARRPGLRFSGIGGPKMAAQGFESHVSMDRLGVRGYAEVLRHYREIMGIRRQIGERMLQERPAVFIGVDSSDFNLDLERRLKDAGIPAIQYGARQLGGRLATRRCALGTHLCPFFRSIRAVCEGGCGDLRGPPLADVYRWTRTRQGRIELRVPRAARNRAFPGSRRSELPTCELFVLTARRLQARRLFRLPRSSARRAELSKRRCAPHQGNLPLTLLFGHSH